MHLHRPIVETGQDGAEVVGGLGSKGAGANLGGDVLGEFGCGDLLEISDRDRRDQLASRELFPLLADLRFLDGNRGTDLAEGFAEIVDIPLQLPSRLTARKYST